jgi:hypothetical protein
VETKLQLVQVLIQGGTTLALCLVVGGAYAGDYVAIVSENAGRPMLEPMYMLLQLDC